MTFALAALVVVLLVVILLALSALGAAKDLVHREGRLAILRPPSEQLISKRIRDNGTATAGDLVRAIRDGSVELTQLTAAPQRTRTSLRPSGPP